MAPFIGPGKAPRIREALYCKLAHKPLLRHAGIVYSNMVVRGSYSNASSKLGFTFYPYEMYTVAL